MAMNDQNIPIDINQNKLLDWLISRHHIKKDWQKSVLSIRQKINNAIQDMPATDEITILLAGSYINYFHCSRIVEILKETEASSKNIFGKYSSQRMKDWLEIVQLYQNENVYLADAAQVLMRNVNYEIPCLKKQLSKCIQTQEDCLKKKADYAKNAVKTKEKYLQSCKQIGIEGKNIRNELLSLLDELPETFQTITNMLRLLNSAIDLYKSFLTFTLHRDIECCLPLMRYLIVKGNTSVYEWRTGELPDVVEETKPALPLDVDNGSTENGDEQIDFGDLCIASESSEERSSSSPNGDFVHVEKEDCKADNDQIDFGDADTEINWDISVETSGVLDSDANKESRGGKVAVGEDAFSVLENPYTRSLFYNELLELEGFLEQRLAEMSTETIWMSSSSDILCSSQFFSAPAEMLLQSESSLTSMLTIVKNISSQLMSVKLKHLYRIKESPKYVDRLTSSLKNTLDTAEKMLLSKQTVELKYIAEVEQQNLLEPKIQLVIEKTRELQTQIEGEISKKYKNRPVNITGTSISRS